MKSIPRNDACFQCKQPLILTAKVLGVELYHGDCLKCAVCRYNIDTECFRTANKTVYCRACMSATLDIPKNVVCFECRRPIDSPQVNRLLGRSFHPSCAPKCSSCLNAPSNSWYLNIRNKPYCLDCYWLEKRRRMLTEDGNDTRTGSSALDDDQDQCRHGQDTQLSASSIVNLPPNLQIFCRQAGGHRHSDGHGRLGFLYDSSTGRVLKHILTTSQGMRELHFYQSMCGRSDRPPFIPDYFGQRLHTIDGIQCRFLELSDITTGLQCPNVLDIKIGSIRRPGSDSTQERRRLANFPYYDQLGFRLDGVQIYQNDHRTFSLLSASKTNRSIPEIKQTMRQFLQSSANNCTKCRLQIENYVLELEAWFNKQTSWRFYSSSLVIACEGDKDKYACSINHSPSFCRASFVDFAHAYPSDCVDAGSLKGIRNFRAILDECLHEL